MKFDRDRFLSVGEPLDPARWFFQMFPLLSNLIRVNPDCPQNHFWLSITDPRGHKTRWPVSVAPGKASRTADATMKNFASSEN
jgi:hypothetical protein